MAESRMNYGKALRRERLRRGLTQRVAAQQLGVCLDTFQRWEWERRVSPQMAGRLSAWLTDPAYWYRVPGRELYLRDAGRVE